MLIDQTLRIKISKACRWGRFIVGAPVVIVGCGDPKRSPKFYAYDVCIALENLVLAAMADGLGACWVGSFDEEKVKGLLDVSNPFEDCDADSCWFPRRGTDFSRTVLHMIRPKKGLREIVHLKVFGKSF